MPLWRHGGVLSVEIESEIKPEKEKNSTHSLTDMRACSFSHAGVTNLGLSLLKYILLIQKTAYEERVVINDLYDGNLFLYSEGGFQTVDNVF